MQEEEYKKPEFVYTSEEYYEEKSHEEEMFHAFSEVKQTQYSFGIRLLAFFIGFLCLMLTTLSGMIALFCLVLNIITAFRNEAFKNYLNKSFNWFKKTLIFALGGFFAVFSPPFGIGLVLMYFLMTGQQINQDILHRMRNTAGQN